MNPLQKLLNWYFSKESLPYWCMILLDCAIVFMSGVLTYWLFNKTIALVDARFEVIYTLLMYMGLSLIGARIFRTYSGIMRYSSFEDLLKVSYANALSLILSLGLSFYFEKQNIKELSALSQTEIVIMFLMATLIMWGVRVMARILYEVAFNDNRAQRALIFGALSGGADLAKAIRTQTPRRFVLKGFISRNKRAKHIQLVGKRVYHIEEDLATIIKEKRITAILVTPRKADQLRDNQALQDLFIDAGCKIYLSQLAKEASVKDGVLVEEDTSNMHIHEVSVEDLLPRSEIRIDLKSVEELLKGQRVLITGSAGSIGSEIVRQVARFGPEAMMLIDQAETPEHDIMLMMENDYPDISAEVVVASICNEGHMAHIFSTFKPTYVFHAAAYKHVPMMEDNPSEAILNNVLGTKIIADLSVKHGVKKFVMVSTDKAVNPTNVMGCSKRICEIYVQSLNQKHNTGRSATSTQFVTTRFGNVLGSNGSVIPLFKEQIKKGGPVTVTDERIVRFFMLISEACKLVLEAGTKGNGGEIFVFDMGKPVKISDLAKRMIALSGAKDVEIKYTGLRPGEKLYEEVLNELEGTKPTFHEKIRIAEVREFDYDEVNKDVEELISIAKQFDNMATVRKMKAIVPEYKSNNSVYERLDINAVRNA